MSKVFKTFFLFFLSTTLLSCAGSGPKADSGEVSPDVMGPVFHDQAVDSQPVQGGGQYGPSSPTGMAAETTTATAVQSSVQSSVTTETSTSVQTAVSLATGSSTVAISTDTSPGLSTSTATGSLSAGSAGATATATTASAVATSARTGGDPKLCLILGPGMAKAMAEASVLEAIHKAKLPVHCVVGTEMGAVVGALFASSGGSTNNLQWQLFKLNKENYLNFPMISLREPRSTGRKLNEFLRGIFQAKRIEELPISFGTVVVDDDRDAPVEILRGDLADTLSASLAVQSIFEPWHIGHDVFRSGITAEPAPVELAKKMGGNFLVVVDVLGESGGGGKTRFQRAFTATRSLMRMEKRDASFVIQVNTDAIPFDEFGRRGEILSAGAAAAEKAMPELQAAWEKWSAGTR
jgi:NTE family protein